MQVAWTASGAADVWNAAKRVYYAIISPNGYAFMPILVSTHPGLAELVVDFINKLAAMAAAGSVVKKGAFVTSTFRELNAGLCKDNGIL